MNVNGKNMKSDDEWLLRAPKEQKYLIGRRSFVQFGFQIPQSLFKEIGEGEDFRVALFGYKAHWWSLNLIFFGVKIYK